jgi:hypothetical protein
LSIRVNDSIYQKIQLVSSSGANQVKNDRCQDYQNKQNKGSLNPRTKREIKRIYTHRKL